MRCFLFLFFCVSCASSSKVIELSWPSDIRRISRHFSGSHDGMDIAAPSNSPVYSAHKGRVVWAEYSKSYGNYIILKFSDQWATLYAHLNKLLVKKGSHVERRQKIGLSGSTGQSNSPHLHFELFKNKKAVNPYPYLQQK